MSGSLADCRWFCHFDDDNYVNVPRLVRFLADYNPREDWYLGKPSIQAPLEIVSKSDKKSVSQWVPVSPGAFFPKSVSRLAEEPCGEKCNSAFHSDPIDLVAAAGTTPKHAAGCRLSPVSISMHLSIFHLLVNGRASN